MTRIEHFDVLEVDTLNDTEYVSSEASTGDIQDRLDTVSSNGGGAVTVPSGTFETGTTITVDDNTWLVGQGNGTTISLANGTDENVIEIVGDNAGVRDIRVDGNKDNNTSGNGIAVAGSTSTVYVVRAVVEECSDSGVYVYNDTGTNDDVRLHAVESNTNDNHGFEVASSDETTVVDCSAEGNENDGFFDATGDTTYIDPTASSCRNGIQTTSSGNSVTLVAPTLSGNDRRAIYANADDLHVDDPTIEDNAVPNPGSYSDIEVNGAENCSISGGHATTDNDTNYAIEETNGADRTKVSDFETDGHRQGIITTTGTHSKWDGVVGGGPIGGYDLTGVTPDYAGEMAYNDGTTGTTGPSFDDGSNWISLVDGTTIA